jgi:nitrous oxide reductase accessory protein NosL
VRRVRTVLAVVLSWAIALMTAGCGREEPTKPPTPKPPAEGGDGGTVKKQGVGNTNDGPGPKPKPTPSTAPPDIM